MSFHFTGAASSRMRMLQGVNTSNFTYTFWMKRLSDMGTIRQLFNLLRAVGSFHGLYIADPNVSPAQALSLQANFAATQAKGIDSVPSNTWMPVAVYASGSNIWLRYRDSTGEPVSILTTQTAYTSEMEWWGDAGGNTNLFIGLLAHIKRFNVTLSTSAINSEWDAPGITGTVGLLTYHSGGGGSVTEAVKADNSGGMDFAAGSGLAYSTDMPTFNTFTGAIITGEAVMPSETSQTGESGVRYNRILHSQGSALFNAVWQKNGHELITGAAVDLPAQWGTPQRVRMTNTNGGVNQQVASVPAGKQLAFMVAKKVDTDWIMFRHLVGTAFNVGAQGHFNLVTGAWTFTGSMGDISDANFGFRNLGNGWWLIWIWFTYAANTHILEFYPLVTGGVQAVPIGRSVDVTAFQLESGQVPTYPKISQGTVAARTLSSATFTLSPKSVNILGTSAGALTLRDSANAPWDQHTGLTWFSSNPAVADFTAGSLPITTNLNGQAFATVRGATAGTSTFRVETYRDSVTQTDLLVSTTDVLTVSGTTSTNRRVEINAEAGWHGVGGFVVAVYAKHATDTFPVSKLFEVSNQSFDVAPGPNGVSRMIVSPPSGISLTLGQIVDVAIENPNYNGVAVAGPGIFNAVVI